MMKREKAEEKKNANKKICMGDQNSDNLNVVNDINNKVSVK